MNSKFRVIRWTSRAGFLALAGALMTGLWLTPRFLASNTQVLGFDPPLANQEAADPDALPADIALPGSRDDKPQTPVPPARLSAELLPRYFEAQSAESLFDELRAEGKAPAFLEPWSQILMGRLLAIDEIVARHSTHYGTDYLGQLLAFAAESLLDPLAQGPQIDDRGLGQVGYWAEEVGRRWAGDQRSRYYSPDLNVDGSIWDPETNIILATTIFRWVYTTPEVTNPYIAYGVYTRGHSGMLPDGSLGPEAQIRADRAASYRERVLDFFRLKLGIGGAPEHPLTSGILQIDRENEDGQDTYRALRDYYIEIAENPADAAMAVLLASEALLYNDLLTRIYDEDGDAAYRQLFAALVNLEARVAALEHAPSQALYNQTLTSLQQRLNE